MIQRISEETVEAILKFRDDRNWKQFHNPKDLALSISLEAAELLECFQWSGSDTEATKKLPQMKEELADVLIYCVLMADRLGVSLDDSIQTKIAENTRKYDVQKAYGTSAKYTEL